MSRGSRSTVATVLAATAAVSAPPVVEGKEPPELPPIPEGPPESIVVESDVVAENRRLREHLESQRAFFETRLQEQAATFDASWAEREREFAAQLQAPPPAEAMASRPRRAVFDASVPLTVAGRRVTYSPGDPVPDHIDPVTLPVGAVRYVSEED